jgi:phospho-N-acetylmuramoyl-pentapeptide-transferase
MLLTLLKLFTTLPAAFFYCSTRMLLSAITALLFTVILGPWFISKLYGLKVGKSIRVRDCPVLGALHEKKKDTPTMGGLLFLSAMFFSLILWMDLRSPFTWMLALTIVWMGCLGGVDDYLKIKRQNSKGVPGRVKMVLQIGLALTVCLMMIWSGTPAKVAGGSLENYERLFFFPFWKSALLVPGGIALFLSMFVITGSSNAVNLTDGLDGLASGCVLFVSGVFALIAFLSNNLELSRYLNLIYIEGSGEVAIFLSAMFGACLGFLWFNSYPAQVFMGDTGSLALGALLGVSAVILRREFLLALVGGVFVIEAVSVIMQVVYFKITGGKRVFLCAPLHHHFEYKGMSERKVVMRFWILGLILALIGIVSIKLQ